MKPIIERSPIEVLGMIRTKRIDKEGLGNYITKTPPKKASVVIAATPDILSFLSGHDTKITDVRKQTLVATTNMLAGQGLLSSREVDHALDVIKQL